ncbi:GntR family transcriptional regulator [Pseudobacteroides cellulosolvens]|uniref:Transcriptional regulator, GntR family n=1 Tax=Pseudobacteroides cellulosolvens ATCC 35603 = DSM 2933 TaxID=398512 RepID=A0A0L6JWJ6_9FIRM|nr:GntR family transcriptional regulator [Pseudobacteroides cellulosolvens]KNY29802.1 transcriptional regulator, GntR family [Pseudobacteroides cellulosolvens ATCC 35603 = DSM 2933]
MRIVISNSSGVPIYEQIKEQIKNVILSGDISEGELLPSIRQLAKDLKISVITTTRAYGDLEQEGFVANVQGKGCYVLPKNSEMVREQLLRDIEGSFTTAINSAKIAKISKNELQGIFEAMLKEENYE